MNQSKLRRADRWRQWCGNEVVRLNESVEHCGGHCWGMMTGLIVTTNEVKTWGTMVMSNRWLTRFVYLRVFRPFAGVCVGVLKRSRKDGLVALRIGLHNQLSKTNRMSWRTGWITVFLKNVYWFCEGFIASALRLNASTGESYPMPKPKLRLANPAAPTSSSK